MTHFSDIDIDFADRTVALANLPHIAAAMSDRTRHTTGVYFQDIPINPLDGLAVYDYTNAGNFGYMKFDFLQLNLYRDVRDDAHLHDLMRDPPWEMFAEQIFVESLAQIGNHFPVVDHIKPRSVIDLAVCIALIRPGKRHLIGKPRAVIDQKIWQKDGNYYFKKSHAISYAMVIVVQLNLMLETAAI